ncbi:MAG: sugar ABC transporter permease [Elusimicrobia bacterium]|nr:sugar ABC transporter permease [Elusimicrobiota bacterium]
MKLSFRDQFTNSLFALPAALLFAVFSIYPFYKVFQLSLYQWDGISTAMRFVGFANFWDILTRNAAWWISFKNAIYITFLALTVQNALALLLAWAVDREIRAGNIYRVIFFIPPILSGIVVGLIWNWIFEGNYGLLNHALTSMGLGGWTRAWLADPKTALYSVATIHMWKGFGWGFIILLAGLQNIPRELYESARVDGAGEWHVFRKITVPLMVPVFVLVSILTILGTMQIFDLIISTTGGGPGYNTEVPMTRMVALMLGSGRLGYACAMSVIFGILLLLFSLVQMRLGKWLDKD